MSWKYIIIAVLFLTLIFGLADKTTVFRRIPYLLSRPDIDKRCLQKVRIIDHTCMMLDTGIHYDGKDNSCKEVPGPCHVYSPFKTLEQCELVCVE